MIPLPYALALATEVQGTPFSGEALVQLEGGRAQDVSFPIVGKRIAELIADLEALGAVVAWAKTYDGDLGRVLFFEPGTTPEGGEQDFYLVVNEAGGREIRGVRLMCSHAGSVTYHFAVSL